MVQLFVNGERMKGKKQWAVGSGQGGEEERDVWLRGTYFDRLSRGKRCLVKRTYFDRHSKGNEKRIGNVGDWHILPSSVISLICYTGWQEI